MITGRTAALISSPVSITVKRISSEFEQDVVREFEVGLVDLVDQEHVAVRRLEDPTQRAELDVFANVGNVFRRRSAHR